MGQRPYSVFICVARCEKDMGSGLADCDTMASCKFEEMMYLEAFLAYVLRAPPARSVRLPLPW